MILHSNNQCRQTFRTLSAGENTITIIGLDSPALTEAPRVLGLCGTALCQCSPAKYQVPRFGPFHWLAEKTHPFPFARDCICTGFINAAERSVPHRDTDKYLKMPWPGFCRPGKHIT